MIFCRFATGLLVAAVAAGTQVTSAFAQAFPEKPLNLIVPFPPGGAGDILGRIMASEMQQRLGKPVIVTNRPGAGTSIAAREVATSPPDGYTILSGSSSAFVFPHAVKDDLPYDSAKDFEPIGMIGGVAIALITFADNPIKDLKSLVAAAKAEPGKLPIASYGGATLSHFAGEMFQAAAGIKMVHVGYKGSAPAMQDLMGKHIAYHVDTAVATRPRIEDGKVRALAVFSAKRSAYLPDVPTFTELGLSGIDLTAWLAFAVPKGVPADVRAKLSKTLEDTLKNEAVIEKLTKLGFEPGFSPMNDWTARITREITEMKALAQKAGIKAEE